ncbi:MAG: MMPL family transporter [Christensenellaceae bacterium]
MEKFSTWIINHKKTVIILFVIVVVFSLLATNFVGINYDLVDYLPNEMSSKAGVNVMTDEFNYTGMVDVMLEDTTIKDAQKIVDEINAIDGVSGILWIGTVSDLKQPISYANESAIKSYWNNNNALLQIQFEKSNFDETSLAATNKIDEIIDGKGYISGGGKVAQSTVDGITKNIQAALIIIVPVIILILCLTMSSFFEIILILGTIGISIFINNGTNIFLGSISFASNSASSILQLAIVLDYTIFLIHRFTEENETCHDPKQAMILAMKKSASSIVSSAATTIIGFLALCFMTFKIGPDMGIVLAKGILISLICVFTILPVTILYTYKLINKTRHKTILPPLKKFGKWLVKGKWVILIVVVLIAVPSFLAQSQNNFIYGSQDETETSIDIQKIEENFGSQNRMVVLMKKGDKLSEQALSEKISELEYVNSITGLYSIVDVATPEEMLPSDALDKLQSENYSMYSVTVNAPAQSEQAMSTYEQIDALAKQYYDDYYVTGETASTYDLKIVSQHDYLVVMFVSILAVGIVLLIMFRSISLPIILLAVIEVAIWLNMSLSYFMNVPMQFIAYLIVSSLQLGATIDYAILMTNRYKLARTFMPPGAAAVEALEKAGPSILTSCLTLGATGFTLYAAFDQIMLKAMGLLVGRGAFISGAMVLIALPPLLVLCDKFIGYTTIKWRKESLAAPQNKENKKIEK